MAVKCRIWLRADASSDIGYGHFVRLLALGEMLAGGGFELVFATRNPTPLQIQQIEAVCNSYVALGDDHFQAFLELIQPTDMVVLDNYFFGTDYQRQIKTKGCKLVLVDDILPQERFEADAVVNRGVDLALLRLPFLEPHDMEREPNRVAICFGGVDAHGYGARCRDFFEQQGFSVELIHAKSAVEVARAFARAEWAVVSASGAMVEALAMGAKVAAGWYVENQHQLYRHAAEQGWIYPLGNMDEGCLTEKLSHLTTPKKKASFDGAVVKAHYRALFDRLSYRYVDYRAMTPAQSHAVWQGRNRAQIRAQMDNPEPFAFEAHERFVASLRDDKRYWALFDNDQLVGSINATITTEEAEIGIFVVPEYWGCGAAGAMERFAAQNLGVKRLTARVRMGNERSLRYFEKMGYHTTLNDGNHWFLERSL